MNADEVVMHEVDRDRMGVVLGLFREAVGQTGETPHRHAHGQILSLDVTRRDMLRVRLAGAAVGFRALYLRRAIAACRVRRLTIQLAPVMRTMARMQLPSTIMPRIWARRSGVSLFIIVAKISVVSLTR